jgi:hypothetical protein
MAHNRSAAPSAVPSRATTPAPSTPTTFAMREGLRLTAGGGAGSGR